MSSSGGANMLRTRGQVGRLSGATDTESGASSSRIKVYLNGHVNRRRVNAARHSGCECQAGGYLNSSDATTRFGTGHDAGAILVTSK